MSAQGSDASAPRWRRMADAAGLIAPDSTVQETIYGAMTKLALSSGAVNLGQGAPGDPTPPEVVEAAAEAMRAGKNQYPPGRGLPELREAIAAQRLRDRGHSVDPSNIVVTMGATEAITASILAFAPAGSTVVFFEPYYELYAAAAAAAGALWATVGMVSGADGYEPDWEEFERVVDDSVSLIVLNTPHNPTGAVFDAEAITRIGAALERTGARLLTDEVYEGLVFDSGETASAAALLGDERVITVSSTGKAYNATGWKIGWLIGTPETATAVESVKQYLTYAGGTPLQAAMARALTERADFPHRNASALQARRDVLMDALGSIPGLRAVRPAAGYFVLADFADAAGALGLPADAEALNRALTESIGVTGIPGPALCRPGTAAHARMRSVIRYSFCRTDDDVAAGAERLRGLAG